jgi:CcmD family protein
MRFRSALVFLLLIVIHSARAEGEQAPDFIRSIGKIYVVAGVCLIILITLFVYIIQLDRKISRIEKRQKNE